MSAYMSLSRPPVVLRPSRTIGIRFDWYQRNPRGLDAPYVPLPLLGAQLLGLLLFLLTHSMPDAPNAETPLLPSILYPGICILHGEFPCARTCGGSPDDRCLPVLISLSLLLLWPAPSVLKHELSTGGLGRPGVSYYCPLGVPRTGRYRWAINVPAYVGITAFHQPGVRIYELPLM
ncbi:hypothetical protein C8J57DRAFT_1279211 [Mycena rebaudengoi]|nr:hypothetical protein C8J57DRAFT_1279211 [Mycena rebaudengoi]